MNYILLDNEISKANLSYKEVARSLGMDYTTFYRKMKRKTSSFSVENAKKLKDLLNLSTKRSLEIFFD